MDGLMGGWEAALFLFLLGFFFFFIFAWLDWIGWSGYQIAAVTMMD